MMYGKSITQLLTNPSGEALADFGGPARRPLDVSIIDRSLIWRRHYKVPELFVLFSCPPLCLFSHLDALNVT